MKLDADVAVVGGGLVGASAALCLARAGQRVLMIEPRPAPPGEPAWDERCIGLNAASRQILESLGVWPAIAAEAAPIRSTVVNEAGRFGAVRFTAADAGLDALGYNTPLRAIHGALLEALRATDTEIIEGRSVTACSVEGAAAQLTLDDGSCRRVALVMACDGTSSALRTAAGIDADRRHYGQTAIVCALHVARAHDDCAWERFTPGGPLAVLPRGSGCCTTVWTQPTAQAEALLALSDTDYSAALQAAFGERLGAFSQPGRRMAWPLQRVFAREVTAPRLLLAGNAAQTLHPVAAQGFNLGLRDCAAAAAVARMYSDPGTPEALIAYAALRAEDRGSVAGFTDALVRLFSNRVPVLAGLRHLGMAGLAVTPAAHRAVMAQNLGLPALARLRAAAA